jgi:hypothetical protein
VDDQADAQPLRALPFMPSSHSADVRSGARLHRLPIGRATAMTNSDRFIRACREDLTILSSFEAFLTEQRAKISHRLALSNDEHEIFRLQGELRCLTNIILACKAEVGVSANARQRPGLSAAK